MIDDLHPQRQVVKPSFDLPKGHLFPPGCSFAVEVRAMGGGNVVGTMQTVSLQPLVPALVSVQLFKTCIIYFF